MKYADSYEWSETFSATNLTATQYSTPWFEVDFANELYSDITCTMASRDGAATLDVDVESYRRYDVNPVLISHTQIAADGTTNDELSASAIGAGTTKIGTRVRFIFTLGGAWTGNVTCTFEGQIVAKRN